MLKRKKTFYKYSGRYDSECERVEEEGDKGSREGNRGRTERL